MAPHGVEIEVPQEAVDEDRSAPAEHRGLHPSERDPATRHQHPGQRDVGGPVAAGGVGPVDHHRPVRGEHDVEGVQIEMQEAVALAKRSRTEPVGARNFVQATVQVREDGRLVADRPRTSTDGRDHRGPDEALDHQLGPVVADLLDRGHRIPVGSCVVHRPGLGGHRSPTTRPSQHQPGAALEDVRVASRREERARLSHSTDRSDEPTPGAP